MEPTIYSDDIIITERFSPRMNFVHRGDIIIARSPSNPHQFICKRVAAVSGDKIRQGIWTEIVSYNRVKKSNIHICFNTKDFCILYCVLFTS